MKAGREPRNEGFNPAYKQVIVPKGVSMYYVYEIQMPEEDKQLLEGIAAKERITLDEMFRQALIFMTNHPQEVLAWKDQFDRLPKDDQARYEKIKVTLVYPVEDGETEEQARNRVMQKAHETFPFLDRPCIFPEISVQEFCDHLEDEGFFLTYGNPVVIRADNGIRLLAIAFPLYERYLRIIGREDEVQMLNRECALQYEREQRNHGDNKGG